MDLFTLKDCKEQAQQVLAWMAAGPLVLLQEHPQFNTGAMAILLFRVKHGATDYETCHGLYRPVIGDGHRLNGHLVYRNEEQGRFLGRSAGGWVIGPLSDLEEHLEQQRTAFGGFHSSSAPCPDDGWESYTVYPLDETAGLDFATKEGSDDDASCSGRYLQLTGKELNQKPIFLNPNKQRMLASGAGDGWVILSMDYLEDFLETQPESFGGFHGSSCSQPYLGWKKYMVTSVMPKDEDDEVSEVSAWEKFVNTTVSCRAVSNSGVVRSEEDFEDMRRKCVDLECGGFAWRKPHFNQFGEEDNPPVCFFYRRTQADLKEVMVTSEDYDFYVAPSEYRPDCSFKVGRDPAPSCHVRWEESQKVHAIACRVTVQEVSPCTYYMACGFHCGYCGIQQHNGSKQQVLFSLWNHPKAEKVQNRSVAPGVSAQPFGGEGMGMGAYAITGTGARTDTSLAAWRVGIPYTFLVRSTAVEGGSEISCSFHKPEGWFELARHFRPEPADDRGKLYGLYSFIEAFSGSCHRRSAHYAAWVQDTEAEPWRTVGKIRGTSTADAMVPNKCVKVCHRDGSSLVEMTTGGDALEDCSLCCGDLDGPPVSSVDVSICRLSPLEALDAQPLAPPVMGSCAGIQLAERPAFYQQFILQDKIGQGSYGKVYLAKDKRNQRISAVKVQAAQFGREWVIIDEVIVWRALGRHPNVVCFYDLRQEANVFFILMEVCPRALSDRVMSAPKWTAAELAHDFEQALLGVQHMHNRRILHRDIKVQNFLYGGPDGRTLKLADFGLSVEIHPGEKLEAVCGSPAFMAPEMVLRQGYEFKIDMWSMGVTFFMVMHGTLLVGKPKMSVTEMKEAIKSPHATKASMMNAQTKAEAMTGDLRDLKLQALEVVRQLTVRDPLQRVGPKEALQLQFLQMGARASWEQKLRYEQVLLVDRLPASKKKAVTEGHVQAGGKVSQEKPKTDFSPVVPQNQHDSLEKQERKNEVPQSGPKLKNRSKSTQNYLDPNQLSLESRRGSERLAMPSDLPDSPRRGAGDTGQSGGGSSLKVQRFRSLGDVGTQELSHRERSSHWQVWS
eukprot:s2532_g8.t1